MFSLTVLKNDPNFGRIASQSQANALAIGQRSPVASRFSPTASQKSTLLNQPLTDGLGDHVLMHGQPSMAGYPSGPIRHTPDELMPEPLTTLAACAGVTPFVETPADVPALLERLARMLEAVLPTVVVR